MNCQYCNNPVPAGANNCPSCGAQVQQQPVQPQFQPQAQPGVAQTNVYIQQPMQQAVSDKNRVAYVILGLFLGGLGVHNFYAGRTGAGVVQLLLNIFLCWTFVVPAIVGLWVLIELITVTKDGKGCPFA